MEDHKKQHETNKPDPFEFPGAAVKYAGYTTLGFLHSYEGTKRIKAKEELTTAVKLLSVTYSEPVSCDSATPTAEYAREMMMYLSWVTPDYKG